MRIPFAQALLGLYLLASSAAAQVIPPVARPDTTHKFENPNGAATGSKKSLFRSKGFRAGIVPAVLIAYGTSTINGHGLYSSCDVRSDTKYLFGPGRHTRVDDLLQVAPYLELAGVLLAGVETRNDRVNMGLVILKSEAIMLSTVFETKLATNVERPDQSNNQSFSTGHTAQAFLAASIVHTELRDKASGTASGPKPWPPAWGCCAW